MSNTSAKDLIKQLSFCVFDLETTGGNLDSDKIIEIGLIKIENLNIIDEKSYLIRPEIKIPEFIQRLTSISQKDVKNSPVIEDVIHEIIEFMGDSILVAHNTSFDIPFFNSVLTRLNLPPLKNKSICTNLMTKYLIPNIMNSNLAYISKVFQIKHKKAHRALDDAQATAKLLINYLNVFIQKNVQKINHLYYPRNRYELDRIHYKRSVQNNVIMKKLQKIQSPYLCTIKGEKDGIVLFSIPCCNLPQEREFIEKQINSLSWHTLTIRLFGNFIEAFVYFNNLFVNVKEELREETINFLWKTHLPETAIPVPKSPNDGFSPIESKDIGDFAIVNHLIPEQFIIFPVGALYYKSALIFRYPDHEKKLLQYIQTKSRRISNNKLIKTKFQFLLREFISNYLGKLKKEEKNIFLFYKNLPLKKEDHFLASFHYFLQKNPNCFNYPREYI
ncbi:MAG: 3'-5' exonuclease [Halobacteriovoraceae bacterium]|nr:3'-5' exonuclease [Halobacteriovoraceae bacterium]